MIVALDIETIGNTEAVKLLPEPKPSKRLKDPAKIAADIAEKKAAQMEGLALDALTARVCCFAGVGTVDGVEVEYNEVLPAVNDDAERALLQTIMRILGVDQMRMVTWNGVGFDLPMIYKRAMILGVDPANFGAPPLSAWTKRYSVDRHYDLMQLWGGWNSQSFEKLDTVAAMVLGERKTEIDVATFPALLETEEGRKQIGGYCLQDTRLTWRLFNKFNGFLFA